MTSNRLPVLPTVFRENDVFPYVEGQQFEFKATHISCDVRKLYETCCAFLNAAGGYILIGVTDKGLIKGISRAGVDTILLHVDNIFHTKVLFHAHTNTLVNLEEIHAYSLPLDGSDSKHIVVIRVCSADSDNVYKLSDGCVFVRLSASNYRTHAGRRMDMERLQSELTRSVAECHTMRRALTTVQRSQASLISKLKDSIQTAHNAQQSMLEFQELLYARILSEKAAAEVALSAAAAPADGCLFRIVRKVLTCVGSM